MRRDSDYAEVAARFARETARHEMRVLHDQGLYRHLRFAAPDGSGYRFDLVTWPHKLVFTGEVGAYTFSVYPTEDMFALFRESSDGGRPNYDYWREKLTAWGEESVQFSQDRFDKKVAEELARAEEFFPGVTAAWRRQTEDVMAVYSTETEEEAREALSAFEYLPEGQWGLAFRFPTSWEWDFDDFDWRYLWACHAIVWGIGRYGAARGQVAA